jgi:hypothetical protein
MISRRTPSTDRLRLPKIAVTGITVTVLDCTVTVIQMDAAIRAVG